MSTPNILWQAAPGVQTDWLKSSAFEKLMAGGAGAGKSSCLLAAAAAESANPAMRSLVCRLSYPMLKDLIAASHLIYAPMRARYNVQLHQWTFPSGAIVEFAAIENTETAILNFSGRSFSFIGIDEIVHLPADTVSANGEMINGAYSFFKSRLRAVEGSGLSLQLASTGTPGGPGQSWIRSYFGIKNSGASCETRDPITGTRRAYFHCTVADNPYLRNTSYAARLEGLPVDQRKAYRDGDWLSYVGQVFPEFNFQRHTCPELPVPLSWTRWRCGDDGYRAPHASYWLMTNRDADDCVYVVRELYRAQLTPAEVAEEVLRIDRELTGTEQWSGVLDSAAWAEVGTGDGSRAEQMNRLKCNWSRAAKGPNSISAGLSAIHSRLATRPDGTVGLKIFRDRCPNLIRELTSLVYDPRHIEAYDQSCPDHGVAAIRYGLLFQPARSGMARVHF